jgi:hypothetical protein
MLKSMKASIFCFSTILVAASLFTSKAFAVSYSVGGECYQLEAPGAVTTAQSHLGDPGGFAYSNASGNTPGSGMLYPINAGMAEVAAVAWAGGKDELDKTAGVGVSNYPNSLTNIGTKTPGGFYNAAYVHPTHVERVEGSTPYWLVQMTGVIGGQQQTFYAGVLDDGRLVKPQTVPCTEVHHPAGHHGKWGGAEKKKWGGKKWGGQQ